MHAEVPVDVHAFHVLTDSLVSWLIAGNDYFCLITDDQRCVQAARSDLGDGFVHVEAVVPSDERGPRWPEGLGVHRLDLGAITAHTSEVPAPVAGLVCRYLLDGLPRPLPDEARVRLAGEDVDALSDELGRWLHCSESGIERFMVRCSQGSATLAVRREREKRSWSSTSP